MIRLFSLFVLLIILAVSVCSKKLTISVEYSSVTHQDIILSKSSFFIQAINIQPEMRSVIFEAHSQMENLTLSLNREPSLHNSVSGTNIGLTSMLKDRISVAEMWIINNSAKNVSVLIVLVPHKAEGEYSSCDNYNGTGLLSIPDPIPGGCNMEFNVKISPFLKLSYNHVSTQLENQQANIGYPRNVEPPSCNNATMYIGYDIYVYFLQENNFNEDHYFKGIEKMANVSFIHQFATKIQPHGIHPTTRTAFYTYPNRGAVYNIISYYTMSNVLQEAAYVPVVTYGCKITSELYGCGEISGTFSKVFFIILAAFGIFLSFRGHQFLKIEMFFFGFLAFSLVGFVLITKYSRMDLSIRDALTIFAGLLGGTIWLILLQWLGHHHLIPMLLVGVVFGFLLTSVVLYTPLGNFQIFTYDQNYWLILCCGAFLITVVFIPFPKVLSITAASVVGSYTVVMAIDQFVGTTLSFIIINVIKRALMSGSYIASNVYPFQNNEILLSCMWGVLSFLGMIIQFSTSGRSRAPNCSHCCSTFRKIYRYGSNSEINRLPYDLEHQNEREPLLSQRQNTPSSTYESLP